jgi:hypothetical protein
LPPEPDNIEQCGTHYVLTAASLPMDVAEIHVMRRRHGTEEKEVEDDMP